MGFRVFITRHLPGDAEERLCLASDVAVGEQTGPIDRAVLLQRVAGVDGLITFLTDRVDSELLDAAGPSLRIVANYAVGVDNIDLDEAVRRGVMVTNTPDVLTETTADLTWALILAVARRLVEADSMVRKGRFKGWDPQMLLGEDVWGKTLGIVGMGRIGQAVARRARGFDMEVLYTTRKESPAARALPVSATWVDRDELLRRSDIVSLHCPLTRETRHLIDAARLRLMKPTAILINTARGPVIDEAALVDALRGGRLAGAGLDVYEEEPRVHPGLYDLRNVVLLPHIGSASRETRERMARMNAEDVLRVARGERPLHVVTR